MRKKQFFLSIMFLSQLLLQAQAPVFDIPIFAYHRFGDNRYPGTNIATEIFEQQLQYLKENNFNLITLGQAVQHYKAGQTFPIKTVILTIDDGYLSFYTHAWPLLKKYGFVATNFIQTQTVGGGDFMSCDQIREIQEAGIEIGNHSASHDYFLNLPVSQRKEDFHNDLRESAVEFEKHLGAVPRVYAYPFGEFTYDMEKILNHEGFVAAVVQQSGVFSETTNILSIPRFPMGGAFGSIEGFKNKCVMKALRILKTQPESPLFNENPPPLKIEIVADLIDLNHAQFFVQGEKMGILEINSQSNPPYVVLKSTRKLTQRRTLYTLTSPSKNGKNWHWFSYLWIMPKSPE